MADHPTSEKRSPQPERNTAARLLNTLVAENSVAIPKLATLARLSVAQLEACRTGKRRLAPEEQMRLAAAVVDLAPAQKRRAHVLYAQAQAELRFTSRDAKDHRGYASRPESLSEPRGESATPPLSDVRTSSVESTARSARIRERSAQLTTEANRLMAAAQAFVSARQALRGSIGEVFRDEVEHFTVAARTAGEPPERALMLMKAAVEPVLATVPELRVDIMARAVGWFVHAYYPR